MISDQHWDLVYLSSSYSKSFQIEPSRIQLFQCSLIPRSPCPKPVPEQSPAPAAWYIPPSLLVRPQCTYGYLQYGGLITAESRGEEGEEEKRRDGRLLEARKRKSESERQGIGRGTTGRERRRRKYRSREKRHRRRAALRTRPIADRGRPCGLGV
ncbi:hypothetical protein BHM03_00024074 [Ensete ventricosum]|nr:hypothetical protein BHM03_00024074 [Ensete ventricosum]